MQDWDSAKQARRVLVYEAVWPQGSANAQEWKGYANTMQRVYTVFLCGGAASKHHTQG